MLEKIKYSRSYQSLTNIYQTLLTHQGTAD